MSQDIVALARRHKHIASHYEGCEADHVGCLVNKLADEVERQRAEIERLLQAIGLATTAVPDMVVDVTNPLGMMQRVVAEVEKLRADLATQQGCCDGAAAQDAYVRQEREAHRAEVEKLRAENERLRKALQDIADDCGDDYPPSHGAIKYAVQDALRGKP